MTNDAPGYPQHDPADPGCPWVGPCQCYRDATPCICGHNHSRHASTDSVGDGPCNCGCSTFTSHTLEGLPA